MVVCHCLRINDRVISRFTADPAVTTDDITRECGAGGQCGGCRPTIDALLEAARAGGAVTIDTSVARPRRRRLFSAA
jgi:bacterioferritin-associated ferredoxin